jgi:hypothetical protein
MGKRKKNRQKKAAPPLPRTPLPPKERMEPLFNWLKGAVGLLLALIIFWPRPTVDLVQPTDPQNPYSASFTITNSTFVAPLDDVTIGVGICQSVTEPSQFDYGHHCDTDNLTMFTEKEWSDQHLSADQKLGVSFGQVIQLAGGAKLSGGDLAAIVKYHWWFVPYEFTKTFRFVTKKQADGTLHWFSRPVDDSA